MSLIKYFAYRALMPRLYHWQNFHHNLKGRVDALRFPTMRIVGPYWSFGVKVPAVADLTEADLPENALYALRLMQEHAEPVADMDPGDPPGHAFPNLHRPQLFRAEVEAFYSYDSEKPNDFRYFNDPDEGYESASRLSIIGVHTLKDEIEGLTKQRLLDHTPVSTGQLPDGDTTELLLATIGGDPGFLEGDDIYLPACQMISGRIGFRPTRHYLKMLRQRLALDSGDPETDDGETGLVYLLPDGFALFGALDLPWIDGMPVSGWFKITPRYNDEEDKRVVSGTDMIVWSETPHPKTYYPDSVSWREAIQNLKELLFESEDAPNWLTLSANGVLDESDLFWPLNTEDDSYDFLQRREAPEDDRVFIRETALAAHLAERRGAEAPLSVLTLKPERFELFARDNKIVLQTSAAATASAGGLTSVYSYNQGEEIFNFNEGGPLELAVPLIDTAAMLRDEQDMPPPTVGNPGLLWTFLPVEAGWLHLPLPNATLNSLDQLRSRSGGTKGNTSADEGDEPPLKRTSGALGFQNRPNTPGFSGDERLWSFTLTDVDDGAMTLVFDGQHKKFVSAEITLTGGAILFDGALRLTPFRQTEERLLPDHAERALASRGFLAVSPSLLRDVEEDVWALEIDGAPAMRVSLRVDGLSFSPALKTARIKGEVTLVTEMHSQCLLERDAARAPWLWTRQSRIPTVQTMPLALAGNARRLPSGSRELAPFRKTGMSGTRSEYKFSGALDMARAAPQYLADGNWERPTNSLSWIDEVGMSLLALPSLTLFPGLREETEEDLPEENRKNTSRLPALGLVWSKGVNAPLSLEVRHDLAIRDEAYATASLPRRTESSKEDENREGEDGVENLTDTPGAIQPEETLAPQPRLFIPRPDNGPDAEVGMPLGHSAWHGVWTGLQRDLALSASEQRTMVVRQDEQILLQGIFGDVTTPVTADFSALTKIRTEREKADHSFNSRGPDPWQLVAVGTWGATFDGGIELGPFAGLPSEADLTGLSGQLPLSREAELAFGTALIAADEQGFYDQRGLQAGTAAHEDNLVKREVIIHALDGQQTIATLATAKKPFRGAGLSFWFADLPLDPNGENLHPEAELVETADDWTRAGINASSFRNAPLQGFRWWLLDEATGNPETPPVAAGIQFTPLSLQEVTLENGEIKQVKILGRPALRLDDDETEPRGSDGKVLLVLDVVGTDFKIRYELAGTGTETSPLIRWPLARRAGFSGSPPVLELKSWPGTANNPEVNGWIRAAIDGIPFKVPVFARFDGDGLLELMVVDTDKPNENVRVLWASNVDFKTTRTPQTRALTLVLADLLLSGRIQKENGDWYIDPEITLDLTKPGLPPRRVSGTLNSPVFGEVDILAEVAEDEPLVGLGKNGLHLEWTCQDQLPNIGSFSVTNLGGLVSAGLSSGPVNGKLRLNVQSAILDASAMLTVYATREAKQQELTLRQKRDDEGFRIYGTLSSPNLFRWPDVPMQANPEANWTKLAVAAGSDSSISHETRIILEGQPFHGFKGGELILVARVEHVLAWSETSKDQVRWAAFQPIRLLDIEKLREKLEADKDEDDLLQASLSVFGVKTPQALGVEAQKASTLIFRYGAAHHSALRGVLRDIWLKETSKLKGIAVDLSAHHQMDWGIRGKQDWLVLPLPHLSVLTSDGEWTPSTPLSSALSSHLDAPETLWVNGGDLPRSRSLTGPSRAILAEARNRLVAAMAGKSAGDAPAHALGLDELLQKDGDFPHEIRSVFQSFTLLKTGDEYTLAALEYPALHHALVLGVLKARGLNEAPQSFSFVYGGSAASPVQHEGGTDPETLQVTLEKYAEKLAGNLVSVPAPENLTANRTSARTGHDLILHVASQDGRTIRQIAQQFSTARLDHDTDEKRDMQWATQTLVRLAPWVRSGTLTRISSPNGDRGLFVLPRPNVDVVAQERDTRPMRSTVLPRRDVPQTQREKPPEDPRRVMPVRLTGGYSPSAAGAALWASENAITPGTGTDGPRLAATAGETVWQLDGGPAPYLSSGGEDIAAMRLHDRNRISFREASPWSADRTEPQRLTAALPAGYHAALPAGLHPVAKSPRARWRKGTVHDQALVPGWSFTARVADRAGTWSEARLGLDIAGLSASERPVNLRTPRPSLLAINDRTRGSSHETGHLVAKATPTLILHGPRAARPGTGPHTDGLSRAPRSAWATLLQVASPASGLIDPSWNGAISFEAAPSTGIENWRIRKAEARIDHALFSAEVRESALSAPITTLQNIQTGETLRSAALSAKPATPVEVLLEVETDAEDGSSLIRQLRFELLTAGTGFGLTEAPVYLRFDDAEYNDRLGGLAKMDFAPVPEASASEMVFAADRSDVRPDDRLELALGLRYDGIAEADQRVFEEGARVPLFEGKEIELFAVRRRTINGISVPQNLRLPNVSNVTAPTLVRGLSLQNDLNLEDGSPGLLLPKDQFELTIKVASRPILKLTFDVVDTPLLPINPSGIAQLRLFEENAKPADRDLSLNAPLYANSPPATIVEIVDPRDLLDGVVRRRAIYQWRSFAPRSHQYRNALQKFAASGATWIEPDLAEGWVISHHLFNKPGEES